jgi:hypothetical protein
MRNEFLRLVSESEPLLLEPTDGSDVLMNERDLFNYIDPNFEDWGTGEKGPATGECPVEVYEMEAEGTFAQLFGSLSTDPRLLCLTQAQILSFVKVHGLLLRSKTFGTFFLFESKGNLLIAAIGICPGGTHRARLYRFEDPEVWHLTATHGGVRLKERGRVVVPRGRGGSSR